MPEKNNHESGQYIRYALIVLGAVLVVLFIFFFVEYQSLRREQLMTSHQFRFSQLLARHAPLPQSEASVIRTWMTFDYINKLFALPPSYLQLQLQVSNPQYPRLTVANYAKAENIDAALFLDQVEAAVREYPKSANGTSTTVAPE